jgi:hypothetical protein|nr:MAG TPA: hypothetical protein [Caudoviricetes sp.]
MGYKIINLIDIYNTLGEEKTKEILNDYKCELNHDVEYFLKEKAILFSKQDISRTFLVMNEYQGKDVIVGYFAITNKATTVKKFIISNTKRKKILRYAEYNNESKGYNIALPLIGQLGKNYNNGYNKLITGDILLKFACDKIKETQNILGGRYVFLECEDIDKLREFYEDNGFECFGKRNLEKDERDKNKGEYLLQMLRDLSKYDLN